jgi:hypothetical protein
MDALKLRPNGFYFLSLANAVQKTGRSLWMAY